MLYTDREVFLVNALGHRFTLHEFVLKNLETIAVPVGEADLTALRSLKVGQSHQMNGTENGFNLISRVW
jgi:hypothetical protein